MNTLCTHPGSHRDSCVCSQGGLKLESESTQPPPVTKRRTKPDRGTPAPAHPHLHLHIRTLAALFAATTTTANFPFHAPGGGCADDVVDVRIRGGWVVAENVRLVLQPLLNGGQASGRRQVKTAQLERRVRVGAVAPLGRLLPPHGREQKHFLDAVGVCKVPELRACVRADNAQAVTR